MSKHQETFKVFKMAYDEYPKEYNANRGMVISYYFLENKVETLAVQKKQRQKIETQGTSK